MTDEEIIEAKSNEIRRLHKLCIEKNKVIETIGSLIDSFDLPDQSLFTEQQRKALENTKNALQNYYNS